MTWPIHLNIFLYLRSEKYIPYIVVSYEYLQLVQVHKPRSVTGLEDAGVDLYK